MINLYFPIDPVPKGRPRITRSGHVYTPQKTRNFEEMVRHLAALQMHNNGHKLLEGKLSVRSFFFFKKPKRTMNKYPARGDIDNFAKSLFDALNGVVWMDDAQICHCELGKLYSTTSSITVTVENLA